MRERVNVIHIPMPLPSAISPAERSAWIGLLSAHYSNARLPRPLSLRLSASGETSDIHSIRHVVSLQAGLPHLLYRCFSEPEIPRAH